MYEQLIHLQTVYESHPQWNLSAIVCQTYTEKHVTENNILGLPHMYNRIQCV